MSKKRIAAAASSKSEASEMDDERNRDLISQAVAAQSLQNKKDNIKTAGDAASRAAELIFKKFMHQVDAQNGNSFFGGPFGSPGSCRSFAEHYKRSDG